MLRNNSLSSLLNKRDADKFKLILLQENGKSIEVQKSTLIMASNVFRDLLQSDPKKRSCKMTECRYFISVQSIRAEHKNLAVRYCQRTCSCSAAVSSKPFKAPCFNCNSGEGFKADLGSAAPAHLEVPYEKPYDQQNDHASRANFTYVGSAGMGSSFVCNPIPFIEMADQLQVLELAEKPLKYVMDLSKRASEEKASTRSEQRDQFPYSTVTITGQDLDPSSSSTTASELSQLHAILHGNLQLNPLLHRCLQEMTRV